MFVVYALECPLSCGIVVPKRRRCNCVNQPRYGHGPWDPWDWRPFDASWFDKQKNHHSCGSEWIKLVFWSCFHVKKWRWCLCVVPRTMSDAVLGRRQEEWCTMRLLSETGERIGQSKCIASQVQVRLCSRLGLCSSWLRGWWYHVHASIRCVRWNGQTFIDKTLYITKPFWNQMHLIGSLSCEPSRVFAAVVVMQLFGHYRPESTLDGVTELFVSSECTQLWWNCRRTIITLKLSKKKKRGSLSRQETATEEHIPYYYKDRNLLTRRNILCLVSLVSW